MLKNTFQGGYCLRIFHALNRFSEDLDFVLLKANDVFLGEPYLKKIALEFDSFGQVLTLEHQLLSSNPQKTSIKLEVHTNPPIGSSYENKILDFPAPFPVTSQDL